MSAALAVLSPGLGVTVQDLGRRGLLAIGVPPSGALDPVSLRLANWLAGNDGGEGALEMRFSGPNFEIRGGAVRLALAGEGCEIEMLGSLDKRYPAWRSITLMPGERFRVAIRAGAPCYLAALGGYDLPAVLGSHSTLAVAGLGGFHGRVLRSGDILPLRLAEPTTTAERMLPPPQLEVPRTLRVILGPQADSFTAEGLATFLGEDFTVGPLSDRMGLRLEGPRITHSGGVDLISDGNSHGAIQVPGSGQPIILMADRGTTGGYPKIAVVISADLAPLGRLAPGAKIRFAAVTQSDAVEALRAQDARLTGLKAAITCYRDAGEALARALAEENLISGVADAEL